MNYSGAVISVGGAPEPIVFTLRQARPRFVLFVVSDLSRRELEERVLPSLEVVPQYNILTLADVSDLADCYERVRKAIPAWLEERQVDSREVYVDITGGTKPMSAALAMAGAEHFGRFTYVSGANRGRDGLGTVVTGTEELVPTVNPWEKLAVRERERAAWLFREGYAEQAAEVLHGAAERCGPELQQELQTLAQLAACFGEIDRFHFSGVGHDYGRIRDKLNLIFSHRGELGVFRRVCEASDHWRRLEEGCKSRGTQVRATLLELLANAKRRAGQRRYDDAIARLYRAVELFLQGQLSEAFRAVLGKVKLECVPAEHRVRWEEEFGSREDGEYELGVRDGFSALRFSAGPKHHAVAGGYGSICNHLQKRNNSILAHGLDPCGEEAFRNFWGALLPVVQVQPEEVPEWPDIAF